MLMLQRCSLAALQRLRDKIAAQKKAEEGAHEEAATQLPSPFRRLAQLNRPEWKYGAAGLACACIAGLQVRRRAVVMTRRAEFGRMTRACNARLRLDTS